MLKPSSVSDEKTPLSMSARQSAKTSNTSSGGGSRMGLAIFRLTAASSQAKRIISISEVITERAAQRRGSRYILIR